MINDYKPIANDVSANVETQVQYETDLGPGGVLQHGYQSGTAPSPKCNKTWRQSSVMSSALAQAISDLLTVDMLDDGDVTALTTKIKSAMLNAAFTTGDVKLTMKTTPDSGWIMCDDGTVGSLLSTATHNNDANKALFLLLWTNVIDTWAPVVGGRGGSALADWNANKKITLTRTLGRALAVAGAGSGLTSRALGENLGEQSHVLTTAEMPSHAHVLNDPGHVHLLGQWFSDSGSGSPSRLANVGDAQQTTTSTTGITMNTTGGGAGHNVMQPTSFLNAMIKL